MKLDQIIPNHVVEIKNVDQILNMGGPWVGDIYIDNILISESVHVDNLIYSSKFKKLFIVKYFHTSIHQRSNYFSIGFFDLVNGILKFIDKKFEMVYVKEIINEKELLIVKAFHIDGGKKETIEWSE